MNLLRGKMKEREKFAAPQAAMIFISTKYEGEELLLLAAS